MAGKQGRGQRQWSHFRDTLGAIDPASLAGPILDLGAGKGELVHAGLRDGHALWGVETVQHRLDHFSRALETAAAPAHWHQRCVLYDGARLPFASGHFSALISWYVLEHIPNLDEVMREAARVVRPRGILYLRAQDTRIAYDGHCDIPLPPFLPKRLLAPWLDEFGRLDRLDYMTNGVFDFTMPQVAALLEACHCEIIDISAPPPVLIEGHWHLDTEAQARALARRVKADFEAGRYPAPQQPFVKARKL